MRLVYYQDVYLLGIYVILSPHYKANVESGPCNNKDYTMHFHSCRTYRKLICNIVNKHSHACKFCLGSSNRSSYFITMIKIINKKKILIIKICKILYKWKFTFIQTYIYQDKRGLLLFSDNYPKKIYLLFFKKSHCLFK